MEGDVAEEILGSYGWLYKVVSIVVLLVALDQLRSAERAIAANASWFLKLEMAAPLVFGTMFIAAASIAPKGRKTMSQTVRNMIMSVVWVMIIFTYQVVEKLAAHWQ
jgi:hypothetical protein